MAEGGLRDSLPLDARLADPLSIKGRGPPGAPPLDGRPLPILSADGELVKELAKFDNFSVRPATGDVEVEWSLFSLLANTLGGT